MEYQESRTIPTRKPTQFGEWGRTGEIHHWERRAEYEYSECGSLDAPVMLSAGSVMKIQVRTECPDADENLICQRMYIRPLD